MIHVVKPKEAKHRNSFGVAFDLLAIGPQSMVSKMHLSFVHPVHRATHRIGLYLDKLGEPGLTQGEAHILAMLAHSGPAKVAELHRGLAHKRSLRVQISGF